MPEHDFIIVGAGSAGCALAERLSASGRYTVLVLEAGGTDRRFFVQMPMGYGKMFFDPAVNWMFKAEPDPGLAGNADHWPRGKILGGSSSINAMVWCRGAAEDYEDWLAAGNAGWGWADMLPVFRAIEDFEGGADEFRGAGGPVHVSRIDAEIHPLTRVFLTAANQAGLPFNPDFNGAAQEGSGLYQITARGGRRMSASRAFLRPAMKRPNVTVVTAAHVTRVLFDGKTAIGVEYSRHGVTRSARARREVILSGGAVNSPQILQLSGIGDPALLQGLGIAVLHANANVGQHLQDHQGINYTWRATQPTLNQTFGAWWGKALAGLRWLAFRNGPLSISMNQGGGFFRTDPGQQRPNMQLYFQAFSTVIPKPGERPILSPDPWPGFSIGLSNCRTRSRGSVAIRSKSPFDAPVIIANAFSVPADVSEMLDAVKFLRRIAAQPAFAGIIEKELLPGPSVQSDADLTADFRRRSGTVYHPVSTCRMGPDPAASVVSPRLKVHGVDRLRVIDASAFPALIAGNTNAPAIAMGWKGASLILEDQK